MTVLNEIAHSPGDTGAGNDDEFMPKGPLHFQSGESQSPLDICGYILTSRKPLYYSIYFS